MSSLGSATVSFIGAGAMAEAMIAGVLNRQLIKPEQVHASHPRADRRQELQTRYGINVHHMNLEAAQAGDIVVLTIKPQILKRVIPELRGNLRADQLVLSIIAGAPIHAMATGLLHPAIARAMPNTPAQIGQGMTVWTTTHEVHHDQKAQVKELLGALGKEIWVEDEQMVDMATALSGTGPTYVFMVMEALIDAGVHLGFSRRVATELVEQTMLGSVMFALETRKHPAELRNMVTSPGGTSAEAIYQMEKGALRTVLSKAVYAAFLRTQTLSESVSKNIDKE